VPSAGSRGTFQEETKRFQRGLVTSALERAHGCLTHAARSLGVTRAHFYNLMHEFHIAPSRTNSARLGAVRATT
jgi:DNA-binding NtrC family response regulator